MPQTLPDLLRAGTLDAELAATLWLLVGGRVPVIIASPEPGPAVAGLMVALLDFLPAGVRTVELTGEDESFDWLPQASELGWERRPGSSRPRRGGPLVRPGSTVLVAPDLAGDPAASTAHGQVARLAIRAATIGYGLAATVRAGSLEDVLAILGAAPVGADRDELSRLGVVLVLGRTDTPPGAMRVLAAHYVRPTARDEHGHVQRLGPAVLATWDPGTDRFEHFAWGVTPELAVRVGKRAGDFEVEVERRREYLRDLVAAGVSARAAVRAAITTYRPLTAKGTRTS